MAWILFQQVRKKALHLVSVYESSTNQSLSKFVHIVSATAGWSKAKHFELVSQWESRAIWLVYLSDLYVIRSKYSLVNVS